MPASRETRPAPVKRKRGRPSTTYEAALDATAELLRTVPLSELTVAKILKAANAGRTTFYDHFQSKEDVVIALLDRSTDEVAARLTQMFDHGDATPDEAFRSGLGEWMRIGERHAAVFIAASECWPQSEPLKLAWFRLMRQATQRLAALIDLERSRGGAPDGAPAEAVAATLVWTTERTFHVASSGRSPVFPTAASAVDALVPLYIGTIYGRAVTKPKRRRSSAR